MTTPSPTAARGFTLIELLTVVAIVATLAGLLLPAMAKARSSASTVQCLSNQRQLMLGATMYTDIHADSFMPALYTDFSSAIARRVSWDFITVYEASGTRIESGAMWGDAAPDAVMQCPEMFGDDNWSDASGVEPATGYNYNTSFLGGPTVGPDPLFPAGDGPRWSTAGRLLGAAARMSEIGDPSWTVVFGDGGFGRTAGLLGANKFMRGPMQGTRDSDIGRSAHGAGAQAFLHLGSSNAVLADGHARSFRDAFRTTYVEAEALLEPETGFLSVGNGVYDLLPTR